MTAPQVLTREEREAMRPDVLARLPRCCHPNAADPSLGCGRHVGHEGPHDGTIDLTAEVPAAELARGPSEDGGEV